MSEENVELDQRANDAFNRRDLDALLALADPDHRALSPLIARLGGRSPPRGHDGVRLLVGELARSRLPDFSSGGRGGKGPRRLVTVARFRVRGHGIGGAARPSSRRWHASTEWRQKRKCVVLSYFASEAEALKAAGLSE